VVLKVKYVEVKGVKAYLNSFKDFNLRKLRRPGKRVEHVANLLINGVIPKLKPTTIVTVDLDELRRTPSFKLGDFKERERKLVKVLLHLLEGYGLIGEYKLEDGRLRCILTYLGDVTLKFISELELSVYEKIALLLTPGLLFRTKARVIALSVLGGLSNLRELYNSVSARYFRGDLRGCERAAYEILEEIRFIGGGIIENYVTSTQITLHGLSYLGLINLISLKEFTMNLEGKFISPAEFLALDFELTGGDYMGFKISGKIGSATLDDIVKKRGRYGKELLKLVEILKREKKSIEVNLEKHYSLPFSY